MVGGDAGMLESRDQTAADAFVDRSRSIRELTEKVKGSGVTEAHLRESMRLSFLQGWHEAMVVRDADDQVDDPTRL